MPIMERAIRWEHLLNALIAMFNTKTVTSGHRKEKKTNSTSVRNTTRARSVVSGAFFVLRFSTQPVVLSKKTISQLIWAEAEQTDRRITFSSGSTTVTKTKHQKRPTCVLFIESARIVCNFSWKPKTRCFFQPHAFSNKLQILFS